MGTAANYEVLHNHISAQLLLSKHSTVEPTGTKSQPVTSQRYLKSKDSYRILGIYSFLRFTCRLEIRNDKNLSCQDNRGKAENHEIHPFLAKKRE